MGLTDMIQGGAIHSHVLSRAQVSIDCDDPVAQLREKLGDTPLSLLTVFVSISL
jgi:hypothetical protein